eukprot:1268189-Prorocentrum_lima.AAC.1
MSRHTAVGHAGSGSQQPLHLLIAEVFQGLWVQGAHDRVLEAEALQPAVPLGPEPRRHGREEGALREARCEGEAHLPTCQGGIRSGGA